ncbi:hypothetical protein BGX26_008712 [Mortierella sp. AD094]|nr:hypothetical protein BGX26_008712 [Mortierella sp. AD094]
MPGQEHLEHRDRHSKNGCSCALLQDNEEDGKFGKGRESAFLAACYCPDPWEFQSRVLRQIEFMQQDLQTLKQEILEIEKRATIYKRQEMLEKERARDKEWVELNERLRNALLAVEGGEDVESDYEVEFQKRGSDYIQGGSTLALQDRGGGAEPLDESTEAGGTSKDILSEARGEDRVVEEKKRDKGKGRLEVQDRRDNQGMQMTERKEDYSDAEKHGHDIVSRGVSWASDYPPVSADTNTVPKELQTPSKLSNPEIGDGAGAVGSGGDEWDFKLATLFSIFESTSEQVLQRALIDAKGDLEQAIPLILIYSRSSSLESLNSGKGDHPKRKKQKLIQPRLSAFLPTLASSSISPSMLGHARQLDPRSTATKESNTPSLPSLNDRLRWKESLDEPSSSTSTQQRPPKPLILYNPEDVAKHCPCTLLFNVLDKDLAARLLKAMLIDSETWNRNRWWLFERMVESPHKTSYFAERDDDMEEVSGWTYNGMKQDQPRRFLPEMNEAKMVIRRIVNELRKNRDIHPYEVQGDWNCNVAAVNHYAHSKESVGWHADKLTYLGPRPTIGSLTLGATRFFRIRKVIPDAKRPDTAGQLISIALPHNSLCIMWPPMQEEWKHEVPPQATVTPHPISGTARINITFRLRREGFSPADTPVCKCGVAMVLRCVFKNRANYGRYFYMCYAAGSNEGRTCGAFHWVDMEEKLKLKKPAGNEDEGDVVAADKENNSKCSLKRPCDSLQPEGENKSEETTDKMGRHQADIDENELDLANELEDNDLDNIPLEAISETDLLE